MNIKKIELTIFGGVLVIFSFILLCICILGCLKAGYMPSQVIGRSSN